jgi:asparagine synthase (glutamine-hydrolysing)
MCGIAGIVFTQGRKENTTPLRSMTSSLAHRGPDGEGHWSNSNGMVHLGHRRLAVLDLTEEGKQPMHYQNRYSITYNGEIYNYLEIKELLSKKGHQFRSNSDTEVILAAYATYGEECVCHFDGMFAFAIWDNEKQRLFCARDRFGEKPLFYAFKDKATFVFGSEIKALKAAAIPLQVNHEMLFYYLNYDVVENSNRKSATFYDNVFSLEAAHTLTLFQNGTLENKRYWQLEKTINNSISFSAAQERFSTLFYSSVERRMRSDVTVGSSLSGGLDSSAVVLAMHELIAGKTKQNTFSARFHDPRLDEGRYIEEVIRGKQLTPHYVYPEADQLVEQLDQLYLHQEQPFGSASIFAQWKVMQLAKSKKVTVILDGQGADEMLAGYPRYFESYFKSLFKSNRKAYHEERIAFETLHQQQWKNGPSFYLQTYFPKLLSAAGSFKRSLGNSSNYQGLHPEFFNCFKRLPSPFVYHNTLQDDLYHSTAVYGLEKLLRFSDRNAMAFSREVRLPFLSHELVEFVFSLPPAYKLHLGWTKHLLRESMKKELPPSIKNRVGKIGFEPPQGDWMKSPKMRERITSARETLVNERFISPSSTLSDWQLIMTQLLLNQRLQ